MVKKEDRFLALKQHVYDNLETLLVAIDNCTEAGMEDPKAELYNQVIDFRDDVNPIEILEELELLSIKASAIEKQIDYWLSTHGMNTIALSWPDFSTKL